MYGTLTESLSSKKTHLLCTLTASLFHLYYITAPAHTCHAHYCHLGLFHIDCTATLQTTRRHQQGKHRHAHSPPPPPPPAAPLGFASAKHQLHQPPPPLDRAGPHSGNPSAHQDYRCFNRRWYDQLRQRSNIDRQRCVPIGSRPTYRQPKRFRSVYGQHSSVSD